VRSRACVKSLCIVIDVKRNLKGGIIKKAEVYGVAEFVCDDGDPYLDEPKDLCESCYTKFVHWWDFTPKAESECAE